MTSSPQFVVTYVDGTSETVSRRPVHFMRAEIVCPKDPPANMFILASLWAACTGGKGSRSEFEAWAETVDAWERAEVEPATEAGDDADPLGQEPGSSPD